MPSLTVCVSQTFTRHTRTCATGIAEKGARFSELEYRYVVALAVRSHPVLSSEQGALDACTTRLKQVMQRTEHTKL
jgi:hypothetical protein